jgi:hypothetical protein
VNVAVAGRTRVAQRSIFADRTLHFACPGKVVCLGLAPVMLRGRVLNFDGLVVGEIPGLEVGQYRFSGYFDFVHKCRFRLSLKCSCFLVVAVAALSVRPPSCAQPIEQASAGVPEHATGSTCFRSIVDAPVREHIYSMPHGVYFSAKVPLVPAKLYFPAPSNGRIA